MASTVPNSMDTELSENQLLSAYVAGYFPMGGFDDDEIGWFSPDPRGIIPLDERFHIPHGLKRTLKKGLYTIRFDTAFDKVIRACAEREEVWITEPIITAYTRLYDLGFAHSVECWDEDGLQGGLYGIALRGAFFGESMFHYKTDASKVALVALVNFLRQNHFSLLDTQWVTDHLKQFGAYEIPRKNYLELLKKALHGLYEEMGFDEN